MWDPYKDAKVSRLSLAIPELAQPVVKYCTAVASTRQHYAKRPHLSRPINNQTHIDLSESNFRVSHTYRDNFTATDPARTERSPYLLMEDAHPRYAVAAPCSPFLIFLRGLELYTAFYAPFWVPFVSNIMFPNVNLEAGTSWDEPEVLKRRHDAAVLSLRAHIN